MTWTDAMIARLKVLHSEDWSFAAIASKMSTDFKIDMSRNAAIGKAGRLGLTTRQRVTNVGGTSKRAYKPAVHKRRKSRNTPRPTKSLLEQAEELATGEAVRLPPDQSPCAVSLMQLEHHHCRWPIDGADGVMMYCGATALEGGSCCPRHFRLAYHRHVRVTPEERRRRMYQARANNGVQQRTA